MKKLLVALFVLISSSAFAGLLQGVGDAVGGVADAAATTVREVASVPGRVVGADQGPPADEYRRAAYDDPASDGSGSDVTKDPFEEEYGHAVVDYN